MRRVAHGDDDVEGNADVLWATREMFRNVDAHLCHRSNGQRIEPVRIGPRRKGLDAIASKRACETFRHLAPTTVSGTEEEHTHSFSSHRNLLRKTDLIASGAMDQRSMHSPDVVHKHRSPRRDRASASRAMRSKLGRKPVARFAPTPRHLRVRVPVNVAKRRRGRPSSTRRLHSRSMRVRTSSNRPEAAPGSDLRALERAQDPRAHQQADDRPPPHAESMEHAQFWQMNACVLAP